MKLQRMRWLPRSFPASSALKPPLGHGSRHRPAVWAVAAFFLALLGAESAASAEAVGPMGVDGGVASYVAMGRGAWVFAELEAAAWLSPRISWGGYFDVSVLNDPLEADCVGRCVRHEYDEYPAWDGQVGLGVHGNFAF